MMAEVKDRYAILTAYPSNREHYDHCIKNHGVNMGIWGGGEIGKPRISGSEAGRVIDRGRMTKVIIPSLDPGNQ